MSSYSYVDKEEMIGIVLDQLNEKKGAIESIELEDDRDVDPQAGAGQSQKRVTINMKPTQIFKKPNPDLSPTGG